LATAISSNYGLEETRHRNAPHGISMSEQQNTQSVDPASELRLPRREPRGGLPAVIEQAPQPQRRSRPRVVVLALVLLISGAVGVGWSWWRHHQMQLPPGIAYGNGLVHVRLRQDVAAVGKLLILLSHKIRDRVFSLADNRKM
jgi:hypothetical protein